MRVNVVCRNLNDDRVLPRYARYLRAGLDWTLTRAPDLGADVVYLMGYFETQVCKQWPSVPVASLFTHREEEPPGNDKAKLFDAVAARVQLRVAMCKLYAAPLSRYGPTIRPPLPVERDRFVIPARRSQSRSPVLGFSGYTYRNRRKGEDLADAAVRSQPDAQWRASGRGWPVLTKRYTWQDMPTFYQGLDVLIVTSRVEGGPMGPLEALSCGVSVVIPRGVGILDELPQVVGIHRYERGNARELVRAVGKAVRDRNDVDREALRSVTEPYTVAAWCQAHREAFMELTDGVTGGLIETHPLPSMDVPIEIEEVAEEAVQPGQRGIYVVAFGDPARTCALRLMKSIKKHMPEIPICLCADRKIGLEDVLVVQPDSDIGGRKAKLRAYELTPREWSSILYLDADTVVVGDIRFYFQLIEDGWEFVICKDPHLMDTMHHFRRKTNLTELATTEQQIFTLHTLQYNGGVWAFGRNSRIRAFFQRWLKEWDRYAGRDQGALIRAMYAQPLRTYLLGNEWNTFEKYTKGIRTAGLMHYPGAARRWKGMIDGRIDSPAAWRAVDAFMARRK